MAVRPAQINPSWQYGELSFIRKVEFLASNDMVIARVNDRDYCVALTQPDAFGVKPFERGDIAEELVCGTVPEGHEATHPMELLSGAMAYDFYLMPGEVKTVIIAAPLAGRVEDVWSYIRPPRTRPVSATLKKPS